MIGQAQFLWTGVSNERGPVFVGLSAPDVRSLRGGGPATSKEMSLLAGESVGQTNRLMSAASIIDEMINGGGDRATRIDGR